MLSDPSLVAHKLSANERLVCASPAYLETHGVPGEPCELADHSCLKLNFESRFNDWELRTSTSRAIPIEGGFTCNSLDAIRTLCLAGTGIARLPNYMVNEDVQAGRLIPLLQAFSSPPLLPFTRLGRLAIMCRAELACSSPFPQSASLQ